MSLEIKVKSVAGNRVRLKSKLFEKRKNIAMIKTACEGDFLNFRENLSCQSIIFALPAHLSVETILDKLETLFKEQLAAPARKLTLSTPAANAVCGSGSSCSRCEIKEATPVSWTRKLIEFGLLTGYAIYILVKENIMGVALASSPFSLTAAVALVAAIPLLKESWEDIKSGTFTLETFMGGTLILAIFFGEVTAAFEIIYILRGGMLLEEYIAGKSRDEIHKLVELDVQKVYVLREGVELEADIDQVRHGDIVVARSGEKIPVDGTIDEGSAEINEAIINGRSEPEFKEMGDQVYAGTICEKGRIYIKVDAKGNDTYIARTMQQVEASLALKSGSELEADKLASKLLKLGTGLTIGTFLLSGSLMNAFAVMIVMSCPCATVLAASTAISGGIANGAKNGILIKGGEALENVSQADVFCFDKTGTLTTGKPIVTNIYLQDNITEEELFTYAAIAEYRNSHPLAQAIVTYARAQGVDFDICALSEIIPGYGVRAVILNDTILVGNQNFMRQNEIDTSHFKDQAREMLTHGQTVVYVAKNEMALGVIGFTHEVREGTKEMLEGLRARGVQHIALLTGDEVKVANAFALDLGFDSVYANQTPQGKAEAVEDLKNKFNKVVMVGDGVNDTFAMSKADVSISFAAGGSEAAIAVSDIAITHSHPQDVTHLYDLSQKSLSVVNQNYWIGTSTNLVGVAFASVGLLSPVAAGAIHIGHTVGIMANSSRLALTKGHDNGS